MNSFAKEVIKISWPIIIGQIGMVLTGFFDSLMVAKIGHEELAAVGISNSIFLMIGFLMIFSWVGIAKVSRSMSLQIKTRQYIEAAKIMGQKDSKIIFY